MCECGSGSVPGCLVEMRRPRGLCLGSHSGPTHGVVQPFPGKQSFAGLSLPVQIRPSECACVGCGMGCECSAGLADVGVNTPIFLKRLLMWFERNVSRRWVGRPWEPLAPGLGPHHWAELSPAARAVPGRCTSGSSCLQLLGGAQAAARADCPYFGDLPGPLRHPLRAGKEGQGERKNRIWAGWGTDTYCLFVLKNVLAFPYKSENPARGTVFTPVTPTSKSGKLETHIWFCF